MSYEPYKIAYGVTVVGFIGPRLVSRAGSFFANGFAGTVHGVENGVG